MDLRFALRDVVFEFHSPNSEKDDDQVSSQVKIFM